MSAVVSSFHWHAFFGDFCMVWPIDDIAPVLRVLGRWREETAWSVLLMGGLLIGGCNVFEGLSPSPNSVEALVADARTALAIGNASRAVRLLERAYDRDSTSVRVRIELGNALYAERELDLFTLRAAAEHLVDSSRASSPSSTVQSLGRTSVCTDGAQPETAPTRYDAVPVDAESLRSLVERASVVERVRRLVVVGVLERRRNAFSSATARVRRKGFLVGAVTAVANGVVDTHDVLEVTGSSLYLDREAEPHQALIVCSGTEETLAQHHGALCALSAAAHRGLQWLRARNRLSDTDQESVLIEPLRRLSDAASARINCS